MPTTPDRMLRSAISFLGISRLNRFTSRRVGVFFAPIFAVFCLLSAARAETPLDTIILGDAASESAHGFSSTLTVAAVGPAGTSLNQPYRYATPKTPNEVNGGDMTFTLAVDPARRNYFTVKFWGGDDTGGDVGRIYLYVPQGGVDYQIGYRHEGDYMPLSVASYFPSLPGRFFYSTTLLPLSMTQGKTSLTFKLVTTGRIYTLGSGYEGAGGNYQFNMKQNSRGVYRAYTHTQPQLEPVGETQGAIPATTAKTESAASAFLGYNGSFWAPVNGQISNRINNAISLTNSIFAPDGVEFLAYSYFVSGNTSPTLAGYQNAAVVTRVRDLLDAYATDYSATPANANNGWGGAYGGLGYAIHLLSAQLSASLDQSVAYGGTLGTTTRRLAWSAMLAASRDYGRLNRDSRSLTNQSILGDESIYKANKGLLALGAASAYSETVAQRYLKESVGLLPWLGSDLAGGGSSAPFGPSYYMVTAKGLTREWGYNGTNYGEMQRYASRFYRLTGNAEFQDQAVKMLKARAPFRRPNVEVNGSLYHPDMVAIGYLAWRGAAESDGSGHGAEIAYGDRSGTLAGMLTAAVSGDGTAVGYAKQMLADKHFLSSLDDSAAEYATLNALDVFADYPTVLAAADTGIRLPMTDGQPDFAWSDEESGVVALKRGSERLWIAPYWQAKAGTGINAVARFHYANATWDQIGTMETAPVFDFGGYYVRPNLIDKPESNFYVPPDNPTNAYAGEKLPLGPLPAGATADGPWRGKVDYYAFRFGNYLFGMNRHATKTQELKTPSGFSSATDLVSGATLSGAITVAPASTVALYLSSSTDAAPVPSKPAWLDATPAATGLSLSWPATSGATSYTLRRALSSGGTYQTLATGIGGTSYLDADVSSGVTYYYRVAAVNANGESYPSFERAAVGERSGRVLGFNIAPAADTTLTASNQAGAPGVRSANWNKFSGGTLSSGIVNSGGEAVSGVAVTLTNGSVGTIHDRGGSTGDDVSMFRTVLDQQGGTASTLAVTGLPFDSYDVYFYVWNDESAAGANDRGGSFTVGSTTYYLRTGTATKVSATDGSGYLLSTDTTLGTGLDVQLGNYVKFTGLSGTLSTSMVAQNIGGGALRLKVSGFQIVGRAPAAPAGLAATGGVARVDLTWTAVAGTGITYSVKRAATAGGVYTVLADGLTTAAYADTGLASGVTYYYVVTAANVAGRSIASAEAFATTTALPVAPTGVSSTAGNAQASLSWSAVAGATSYNVKRSTTSGGPYTTIATGVTTASYTDSGVSNGTTYYYVISAVGPAGEGANSAQTTVTPVASLPSPWASLDVGAVAATGNATHSGGVFTVVGSGADIWSSADEFRYVWQTSTGDCELIARVASLTNTNTQAKSGVMIRESTAANARYAGVFITPGSGVRFQSRTSSGGTTSVTTVSGVTAPRWVRIRRVGNSFTAFYSANGTAWTQIGSARTISMTTSATLGLAVSSRADGTLCTSAIDSVTATP